MSCTSPLLAVPDQVNDKGYPVKGTKYNVIGKYSVEVAKSYPNAIKLPCGQCLACKRSKCKEWADRMILELDHSKKAVFLTLTYRDEDLPNRFDFKTGEVLPTLCKRDLTNFMKRLRKQFKDKELRFYACGEYG